MNAIRDELGGPAGGSSHHRCLEGHRFQNGVRCSLVVGGLHAHVERVTSTLLTILESARRAMEV